jgi:signal transduction histidine kinase
LLDLGTFVRKAAGRFSGRTGAKNVRLNIETPDDHLEVRADPFRLEQVMANLLNNATQHAPEGGFVRIGVFRDGGLGVVEVENEGEPIDERELPLLLRIAAGGGVSARTGAVL